MPLAAPRLAVDVVHEVVRDAIPPALRARMSVVVARDVDGVGRVADDVVAERDVLDDRPRRLAVLVARREEDRVPGLRRRPHVLEHVALDEDAPRVLQLERVLHRPLLAAPRERLGEVVAADRDVGGHEVRDRRIGSAEHDVLARGLEIVVLDQVWAGPVPAADRLAVLADRLDVGDVAVDDVRRAAVERDAALLPDDRIAMDVDAVEDQIVRDLRCGLRCAAERDDVAVPR